MEYGWLLGIITFLVGLLLAVGYECLFCRDEKERCERESSPEYSEYKKSIKESIEKNPDFTDFVLRDYETMNREIQNRGTITEAVGAILITASFLILANVVGDKITSNVKYAMGIVSIALFVVWLFVLNYTTKKLDNMTFSRMRAIEQELGEKFGYRFGVHSHIKEETEPKCCKETLWINIRRRFWVWILILLSFGWALIFGLSQ